MNNEALDVLRYQKPIIDNKHDHDKPSDGNEAACNTDCIKDINESSDEHYWRWLRQSTKKINL